MNAKTLRLILLIFPIQAISTFAAEEFIEYKNASVIPIHWTRNGTALVLLGKEQRKTGTFWCDFFGKKDAKDNNNPIVSAQREAFEESAYQLKFIGDPKYCNYSQGHTVHFIWEVDYVDPQAMRNNAERLRARGRGRHIEKTDWTWVTLQDLLEGKTALDLHWTLKGKLRNESIRPVLEKLCHERQQEKRVRGNRRHHRHQKKEKTIH